MSIHRNHRAILALACVATLGAAGGLAAQTASQAATPVASPPLDMYVNELPNPLAAPFRIDTRIVGTDIALEERVGTHSFGTVGGVPFARTPSFGYWPANAELDPAWGAYLGPTIEAKRDTTVTMTVTNRLAVSAGPDYVYPAPAANSGSNEACREAGLKISNPMASYFDPTIAGWSALDKCAPSTAVHLHGGHTAVESDGGPMDVFRAAGVQADDFGGGSGRVTYTYGNDQEAATLWYHDHAMANTRFNPMSGLAGFYLIRDDRDTGRADNTLGLPYTDGAAAHEMPIVLQDRQFNADGTLFYPPGLTAAHPNWSPESFGDVAVVNGTAWPRWSVGQGLYRVRLLNGSNARFYRLQVIDAKTKSNVSVPIYQIGAEGGLFNSPVPTTAMPNGQLVIAPGERSDLVIDFRNVPPGAYNWINTASAPYPNGANNLKQILQFNVTSGNDQPDFDTKWARTPWKSAAVAQPDVVLRSGAQVMPPTVPAVSGTPTTNSCWTPTTTTRPCIRTMFLNEVLDPVTGAPVEVLLNNLRLGHEDATMPSGHAMNTGPGQARVQLGTMEEWDIVNATVDAHPIHLHTTHFQVINRQNVDSTRYLAAVNPLLPFVAGGGTGVQASNGLMPPPDATPYLKNKPAPPLADEKGWKDTIITSPGTVTRILVPFGGTADPMTAPVGYSGPTSAFTGGPGAQFLGTFVWHCHILEHEENDMMQALVIE